MSERTRALILGSTGCIGNNVARACLDAGWAVRAFHRPGSDTWMIDGLDVEPASGDLQGLLTPVSTAAGNSVELVIDQVVP